MTSQSEAERDKAVVDAFYQAGIEGHLTSFARYLDPSMSGDSFWRRPLSMSKRRAR